ncbi:MAG: hypothetical protein PGN09_06590 [Sphingomonas fennica]
MAAFTISFGINGNEDAWYFRNGPTGFKAIDTSLLPGPKTSFRSVSDQLVVSYTQESFAGELLYKDRVLADGTTFDQQGDWNTVKNAQLLSDAAQSITLDGFVHVDAQVGLNDTAGSNLLLNGVKRANVITGAGNDVIDIRMVSDVNSVWQDSFRINTGAGDDCVTISGLNINAELAAGDSTYIQARNKPGLALDPTGEGRSSYTALGAGNDRFTGFTSDDHIAGQQDRGTIQQIYENKLKGSFAYAVGGSTNGGCDSILYKIDLKTGAAAQVGKVALPLGWFGSIGGLDIESLGLNPKDGQLYGFASKFGILDALVRIDPTTAKTTYIKLNLSGLRSELQDMAFDTQGNLFLVSDGDFLRVNPTNGAITKIGNNTLNCKIGAMSIDPTTGKVYAIGEECGVAVFYEINKTTGKLISANKLGGVGNCPSIEAMSFDASGQLFALDKDSGALFKIDIAAKAATMVARTLANKQMFGDGFEAMTIAGTVEKVLVDLKAVGGDVITTGGGADHVYYKAGHGVDRVTDFQVGVDTLHIGGYAAKDIQIDVLNGDTFIRFKDASADGFVDDAMIELSGVTSFDASQIVYEVPAWV